WQWGNHSAAVKRDGKAADLPECWQALANRDAVRAFRAMQDLIAEPRAALELLGRKLSSVSSPKPARLAELMAKLDSSTFETRDQATEELRGYGEAVRGVLERARDDPSAEVRLRVAGLLEELDGGPSAERLRFQRALMVLEYIGSTEATDRCAKKVTLFPSS